MHTYRVDLSLPLATCLSAPLPTPSFPTTANRAALFVSAVRVNAPNGVPVPHNPPVALLLSRAQGLTLPPGRGAQSERPGVTDVLEDCPHCDCARRLCRPDVGGRLSRRVERTSSRSPRSRTRPWDRSAFRDGSEQYSAECLPKGHEPPRVHQWPNSQPHGCRGDHLNACQQAGPHRQRRQVPHRCRFRSPACPPTVRWAMVEPTAPLPSRMRSAC